MSKSAESTVLKRKPSPAEKQECYKVFADLRQKMYGRVATIGMTPEEFEVLNYFSLHPIATIHELQRDHEFAPTDGEVIRFKDGAKVLASVSLTGGSASITISTLTVGTHSVSATYAGDANYFSAKSVLLKQVVNP